MIGDVSDNQKARGYRLPESLREIVENDHPFTGLPQLPHDVTSDVAGTAGDQNRIF
jgi:hypothetical protein